MKKVLIALACALLIASYNLYANEERGIEEILVTAQRTTESIQDVPIAVSAFNSESLQEKQIDAFADLRFHVPNVTYNKTNFTGKALTPLLVATNTLVSTGMAKGTDKALSPFTVETNMLVSTGMAKGTDKAHTHTLMARKTQAVIKMAPCMAMLFATILTVQF